MKLFTPEKIKSEEERQVEGLLRHRTYLTRQVKDLETKLRVLRGEYEEEKGKTGTDFADQVLKKKEKLFKELKGVQDELNRKKDLYYSLIERQDELDEREEKIRLKEANLDHREQYVKMIEQRIADQSYAHIQ